MMVSSQGSSFPSYGVWKRLIITEQVYVSLGNLTTRWLLLIPKHLKDYFKLGELANLGV